MLQGRQERADLRAVGDHKAPRRGVGVDVDLARQVADGDRDTRDQLQMGEHLKKEKVEGMCSSVFSYPGATRSIVCPEVDMGAGSVGGADMG